MIVIVTGSRTFNDYNKIKETMDSLTRPFALWHGGAQGADELAGIWASLYDVPVRVWLPDWATLGKRAGVVRSAAMCDGAPPGSLVVAFIKRPISASPGTAACIKAAKRAALRVKEVATW